MPRLASNNSVAASLEPVSGWRPNPPRTLGRIGKALWRSVVDTKPAGFFDPVDLPVLEEVCKWEEVAQELQQLIPSDDELEKRYARARDKQRAAMRTLRLTKQATTRADTSGQKAKVASRPAAIR